MRFINWLKGLLKKKKKQDINSFCYPKYSIKEQAEERKADYYKLIESNRRRIEVFCKEYAIEWRDSGKEKTEAQSRKERLQKYETLLHNKIKVLDLICEFDINLN